MPRTEVIREVVRRDTWRERIAGTIDAVRSYWSGPLTTKSPELARFFGGTPTSTGITVNEHTALSFSAVYAAVALISGDVASLPLIFYRKTGNGGRERFTSHSLYRILHDEPNPEMSSMTFRETLQGHLLTYGNAYAEIERDSAGRPMALWPLTPERVAPFRDTAGRLGYRVASGSGEVTFAAADMLHIPGLGYDGMCGYSVIAKARESIALGIATERFGGAFFGNGATFGGVISYPGAKPNELVIKNTQEALDSKHQGVERAHRLLALYNGAKYERMGIPPEDAQFLETRKFQVNEIARWFNIPPHKLRDLDRATFSNIEQQAVEYVTDTLRPWLTRWEHELRRKLISPLERNQQDIEHVVEGLLRGDAAGRAAFYKTMVEIGAMTVNEVRVRENMNPLPGGGSAL
jgi:HK97 family phage portal protein